MVNYTLRLLLWGVRSIYPPIYRLVDSACQRHALLAPTSE